MRKIRPKAGTALNRIMNREILVVNEIGNPIVKAEFYPPLFLRYKNISHL